MARPTKLTPELYLVASTYLDECKDSVEHFEGESGKQWETWRIKLPTVAGLARKLGISRSTLYKWADEQDEFSYIVEDLLLEQDDRLVNQGLSGAYNPTIAKLLLSSKHGYVEQSATDVTSKGERLEPSSPIDGSAVDAFVKHIKHDTSAV